MMRLNKSFHTAPNQSGNVLFLILIAVALFAALSYVVSQSTRSGGNSQNEKASLQSAEIISYITGLNHGIMRMIATGGCTADEISFYMPSIAETSVYNRTPEVDNRCKIFHPDGGSVPYRLPPSDSAEDGIGGQPGFGIYEFTGSYCIPNIGTGGANCDSVAGSSELIIIYAGLTKTLCTRLNEKLGINTGLPPTQGAGTLEPGNYFTSEYPATPISVGASGPFDGKYGGCFQNTPDGWHIFYHVLLAR